MKRAAARCGLVVAAIGTLTACESDGPDPILSLTGSVEPVETAADQRMRSIAIAARSDGLAISTVHGETDSAIPGLQNVTLPSDPSDCSGPPPRCTATEPGTGAELTLSLGSFVRNLESDLDTHEAVLTKSGITLTDGRGGRYGPAYRQYGAWMDHAGFFVLTGAAEQARVLGATISITLRGAAAGGELAGSRPATSATWQGLMTGTPATEDGILQGDANLTYDMAGQTLDADFTNIVDLDRNAAHAVSEASFTDVPVAADGTFSEGTVGDLLRGGFKGPGHEEVVGVFEQSGIVGAFGAKRQ